MKTKNIFVVLMVATLAIGCKKDGAEPTEKAGPAVVTFTLNAVVEQTDDFQIFYKEDNNMATPFDELSSVWVGVPGKPAAQDIVFALPEDVYPTNLRFDLGHNSKQTPITINSFTVAHGDKTFVVNGKDFFNYFVPDTTFVKADAAKAMVMPIAAPGKAYDPMLFSAQVMNDQLAKLAK